MSTDGSGAPERGPIAYMAENGVAANLLMCFILVGGVVSLTGLVQEAFPLLSFDQIEVSVPYPGASPEEVEEVVVRPLEERLQALEAVDAVTAVAARGRALVTVEVKSGTDMQQAFGDVEAAVARVDSFPAGAERPQIARLNNRQSVMRLVLYGDTSERALKELALRVEDRLAALPVVSFVETTGVRQDEISIEVSRGRLRALGLTLADVATAVRRGSLELSAGRVETRDAAILVRTAGRRYTQQDFEEIIVVGGRDGTTVRLGDIADVRDGFRDVDLIVRHDGQPAAFVEVYRTADEMVLDVARAVEEHLRTEIVPSLPAGVGITIWNDEAQVYEERRDLLIESGLAGLMLVLVTLALFMQLHLAFWVAVGIAVSVIGAAVAMLFFGISLNSFSLFGIVIVIGLVVDDAVVVAESIHLERSRNPSGVLAAIRGTRRVTKPLIFAVLTTMAAFAPLLFVPGSMGTITSPVPIILISVLAFSILESTLILPHHLSHMPAPGTPPAGGPARLVAAVQTRVDAAFTWFRDAPLDRGLRLATARPEIVVAACAGAFIVCVSLIPAGFVGVTLNQPMEADVVTARLEMIEGTPARRTNEVARELEAAGRRAVERLSTDRPAGAQPLLEGVSATVGLPPRQEMGAPFAQPSQDPQSHIATVQFKLLSARQRDVSAGAFQDAWRDEVDVATDVRGLAFTSEILDLGRPVHAELGHPDPQRLAAAAAAVEEGLRELEGVFDVRSDRSGGLQEIRLALRPEARTLGVTLDDLARQVRSAFFGEEALRVQRGREDVRVYVRLPEHERDEVVDVERYLIRTPGGAELPLRRVATVRMVRSPSAIYRQDGQRIVTVTADVDPAVSSGEEARAFLEASIVPEVMRGNPGLTYAFGGRGEEAAESFDGLYRGFVMALVLIYALLAIPLRSYVEPLIVMAVIPLGLLGAILGHVIMGLDLTFMSMLGILGLSGVLVNDSLVMLDFINRRRAEGAPLRMAVIDGAKGRFRPIFLTSATTFLGLAPLTFDQGIQAQALVPTAVSMSFGIVVATAVLMLLVPALVTMRFGFTASGSGPADHYPPLEPVALQERTG